MPPSDSKDRFLDATARLVRERGYAATGIADVVTASGAPKGSLYFLFPGGKEQLVAESLARAGALTCELMRAALTNSKTAHAGLELIFGALTSELESSDFRVGCPVATVAAEAPDAPLVREEVSRAMTSWHAVIRERLVTAGARPKRADDLAELLLSIVEGALLLAKARKSTRPLEVARREMVKILKTEGLS
jgi:TetR/AcrR family transcriptional repressor of lmrAB and yxaGH operons